MTLAGVTVSALPLDRLAPHPDNPRHMSPEAEAALAESVSAFGLVEPIVWNRRTGYVIGGHQRLKVLAAEGRSEAAVVVVDLPVARERALMVALNSGQVQGEFTETLGDLVDAIVADEPDLADDLRLGELVELLAPSAPPDIGDPSPQIDDLAFYVQVTCRDETHQVALLERLKEEGLECRPLMF